MNIVIIGATSAIAKATARLYAEKQASLYLLARNETRLNELVDDLKVRGAKSVAGLVADLAKTNEHKKAVETVYTTMDKIDLVLICHGDLPDQAECEIDYDAAAQTININALSFISLLTLLGERFKQQGDGTIAVITSVAGDRGRQPNYVYGASKAMVSTYLQGFRGRMHTNGIHVLDIKPGLVDSPMTAQFEKGALWSSPERVANAILSAVERKRHVIYTPGYWRIILFIVRAIPEFIFKRLKF